MTVAESPEAERPALSEARIREIAGPIEDDRVVLIQESGAGESELLAAVEWLTEDDAMGRERHGFSHGLVSRLCEILSAGEPGPDEER